jgi:hypothetical protein
LLPLFGHDIWLHALEALVAGWLGFRAPAREPKEVIGVGL